MKKARRTKGLLETRVEFEKRDSQELLGSSSCSKSKIMRGNYLLINDLEMYDSEGFLPSYQRFGVICFLLNFFLYLTICMNWPNKVWEKSYRYDCWEYFCKWLLRDPKREFGINPLRSLIVVVCRFRTLYCDNLIVWIILLFGWFLL